MRSLRLTPRARDDLADIWTYSAEMWGDLQADAYLRLMWATMTTLSITPGLGMACDAIRRGYRRYPAGSHMIYYRSDADFLDIIRILHNRRDAASALMPR